MNNWKLIIISLLYTISTTSTAMELMNQIKAIVNDEVVLESDIDHVLNTIKININKKEQKTEEIKKLRNQILENLILDNIILQIAKKMQIQISEEAIDTTIANVALQNGLKIDELQKKLAMDNINFESYRNNIRQKMMINQVRNYEISKRIIILPQEVDSLSKQLDLPINPEGNIELSHIFIPIKNNTNHQEILIALDHVKKIIMKLKKGISFEKLALLYSTDTQILKYSEKSSYKIKELPNIFHQYIQNAKKNDIIGPIRSNFGFHILKIKNIENNKIPIYITEVKIRHILIKFSPIMNNSQAYEKIKNIKTQIETGKINFQKAAKKYSEDLNSAKHGGEIDWNRKNVFDPIIQNNLTHLKKNQISQPIQSSFGWHLIQVQNFRKVNKTDEIKKNNAYNLIFNRKFKEEEKIWIQEKRASAYIKILNTSNNK
ncbi:peptidylprolyl isomerase SurA [Arsenophonus symbiont of Ornithomya chloropus]|uniref:peptidylprolyl isomerase SurA n=1 Tax=Arsenophonus symbiont of Ornithomya chloropus TaxID=634121 RepID=UPI0032B20DE7